MLASPVPNAGPEPPQEEGHCEEALDQKPTVKSILERSVVNLDGWAWSKGPPEDGAFLAKQPLSNDLVRVPETRRQKEPLKLGSEQSPEAGGLGWRREHLACLAPAGGFAQRSAAQHPSECALVDCTTYLGPVAMWETCQKGVTEQTQDTNLT
ncbi:hypothetical protein TREES_T100016715 [Tupaia chinensis]|uniref:Uncharacterized protein n=1 Tax=Tupaia chinensis TaxID=246437 RepID=L9L6I6_TUPCH|nr:hypothetical protein TREES_T100016715 [Tupaia chinensis]